ncbi:circadian-associated transcriptional repressor-like [Echeneis naucrates]|uniref:circadian-associated transcriptional repressor-like n=1 Tax=Echeneis naucrates TaxID=173247 RepID=UPI00111375F0|nr:circadian-associated transcriptional repressor-like [Echeneis naucrates]XP_029354627.1 circadian-associated transcriptional repressor-like [Echeneis naucrates]XP_029354628.1 circadian-associated transcriptional repressor-like [Echeneis naucrates]
MSTSDSDYSIDLLASDEEDCDIPKRLGPLHVEEQPAPSSSLSTESPPSCFQSGPTWKKQSHCCDCKNSGIDLPAAQQTPAVSPPQGFTSTCSQQKLSVQSQHHSTRKRRHNTGLAGLCEQSQADTENELFWHKCMELQCYIQPLSSILWGLRSGRYSERLSSFQESVAMDRIQRILGVLQNPNMGGRFLSIILKIQEMLHSWFPHIKSDLLQTDDSIPPKKQKQHHSSASPPPSSPASPCSSDMEPTASYSSAHSKWPQTSPLCSLKAPELPLGQPINIVASSLPARCSNEVTQDAVVSSSTDSHTGSLRHLGANPHLSRGPLPFKISSPCLERLLQAKDSIIAPRTVGDGGWPS